MDRSSTPPSDRSGRESRPSLAPADGRSIPKGRESRPGPASSPAVEAATSGALIATGREVTKELIGNDAYEKALRWVPKEIAAEYRRVTALEWVPLSVVEPVILAMGTAAARDALDLQDEVAKITVERSLRTIWRMFLRFTSNEALISRMPIIFSKSYNKGHIRTSFVRADKAIIELCDWPQAPPHILRTTRVGLEATLRVAGRGNARVSFERTPRGALYTASGLG